MTFESDFMEIKEIADCVKRKTTTKFNTEMHLNILGLLCFKLGVMIDSIAVYPLIVVKVTLTLIQGHRGVRKQKLLYHLSLNQFGLNMVYC